jgi:hypothetical protein
MKCINRIVFLFIAGLAFTPCFLKAQSEQDITTYLQQKRVPNQPLFRVENPDYNTSPLTGMNRKHWKDAALYLLTGAFSYIDKLDDPMQFPKLPGKSYPRNVGQVPTEKLEGLCRTLFIATPLLKENPDLVIHHIKVADYYRYQISKLVDSTSPTFIKHRAANGGPSQNLVEFGALSVSLFSIPDILWDSLSQTTKDALAATMLSYGDGPTIPSNWKFFNIFVLSFYKSKGYAVNEKLLGEYLQKSLDHYRGNGWYNDNPAYDYYSMWAFQMYGMLWSNFFGNKYYPEYASKFKENFKPLKDNYPYIFSRNGEMIMWGRSITYRFGSVIPFPLMGLENDPSVNYGWMRRIASGVILQFLKNPSFLQDNIPTLGFYGPFEPAIQSYSCRGSVFWMGKAFLGLLIPADNPFWKAKENEGPWEKEMKKGQVYNRYQGNSNILITDYPNIGASEIRAWCHVNEVGANEPFRSSECYNRLSYSSAFPWQADSSNGTVSMNYIFKNKKNEWEPLRIYTFKKFENGAYYRDAVLETDTSIKLNLVDIPLPNGILRVDRVSSDTAVDLRLGHYSLPDVKEGIKDEKRKINGVEVTIIDNGVYQLAMVPLKGWSGTEILSARGLNPVSTLSKVIDVVDHIDAGTQNSKIYITLMLWKKSGEKWTSKDLFPVQVLAHQPYDDSINIKINSKLKTIRFE